MEISLSPGTYVLAVSGGVDSAALLHILKNKPDIKLVVAHFDHGIRTDSTEDRKLVQKIAGDYRLPFVFHHGNLGAKASENEARKARYAFLRQVKETAGAKAIITAHHQDDVLETVVLNLLRGTGRKGLSSLTSTYDIARPLLHVTKQQLLDYAKIHNLVWREDSTNLDTKYARNHVRHTILPRATPEQRLELLALSGHARAINREIDHHIINILHQQNSRQELDRHMMIMLPHTIAREVMAAWLRSHNIRDFDRKTLERLIVASKTYKQGRRADINKQYYIATGHNNLALHERER